MSQSFSSDSDRKQPSIDQNIAQSFENNDGNVQAVSSGGDAYVNQGENIVTVSVSNTYYVLKTDNPDGYKAEKASFEGYSPLKLRSNPAFIIPRKFE
jgi:hypothetical protein